MGKVQIRLLADIIINLLPIILAISDAFTVGANRQQYL